MSLNVLVVVEGVVGGVFGLDLGESPVDVIAVRLPNAAAVVVGIEEVDVDASCAVRLEGLEEPPRPRSLSSGVLAGLVREPHGVDDDVVGHSPTGVAFDFLGRRRNERFWLLIEHGDTEICKEYPGLDEDLYITAEAEAFVKWHAGRLAWAEATRDRRVQLHGPSWLVRAFSTWNARSAFAHIEPVSRTAASLAG